jgi:hypothetical protein
MPKRLLFVAVVAGLTVVAVRSAPDLRRYLKIRSM